MNSPYAATDTEIRDYATSLVKDAQAAHRQYGQLWGRASVHSSSSGRLLVVDDTQHPSGSFKMRGATVAVQHALQHAAAASAPWTILAASSGSFGISVAIASAVTGTSAAILMPRDAAEGKKHRVRCEGAALLDDFETYEAAKHAARCMAAQHGNIFIDGVSWPVFHGNATLAHELYEAGLLSGGRIAIIIPLGIGSLSVPTALFCLGKGVEADIFAAEPLTHCKFLSQLDGSVPSYEPTLADGAAVRDLPPICQRLLPRLATGCIGLTEPQIASGIKLLWDEYRIRSEGAGALAVAGFMAKPQRLRGYDRVIAVVTGSNISEAVFESLIEPAI